MLLCPCALSAGVEDHSSPQYGALHQLGRRTRQSRALEDALGDARLNSIVQLGHLKCHVSTKLASEMETRHWFLKNSTKMWPQAVPLSNVNILEIFYVIFSDIFNI